MGINRNFAETVGKHRAGGLARLLLLACSLLCVLVLAACTGGSPSAGEGSGSAPTEQAGSEGSAATPDRDAKTQEIWIVESITGTQHLEEYDMTRPLDRIGHYDEAGRLTSVDAKTLDGESYTMSTYGYDDAGRLSSFVSTEQGEDGSLYSEVWAGFYTEDGTTAHWNSVDTVVEMRADFSYDADGKLSSVRGTDMHVGQNIAAPVADYGYDELGRLIYITGTNGFNDTNLDIYYGESGNVSQIDHVGTTWGQSNNWTLQFDENGKPTAYTSPSLVYSYEYDETGKLTGATSEFAKATFTTDENGNVTSAHIDYMPGPHGAVTTTDYQVTWRKVAPLEDGSYPLGVASLINPFEPGLPWSGLGYEFFSSVEGGNPTSALEAERLIRQGMLRAADATPEELAAAAKARLDGAGASDPVPDAAPAQYHVSTANFEFDIPSYWRGKVEWEETDTGAVIVYPTGLKDFVLLTVTIENGAEATVMGDIGTSYIAGTKGGDTHIEAWRRRYTFDVAFNTGDVISLPEEQIESIVDLCTMGQARAADIRGQEQAANDVIFLGDEELAAELNASLVQH